MSQDRVTINIVGNIAHVELNRPEKRNALDAAMFQALAETGTSLMERNDIRCVIISGAGEGFCAGLDFSAFGGLMKLFRDAGGLQARSHGACNIVQYVAMVWRNLPMPVIAAVHGHTLGGGFQIMLGADIRISSPDALFSILEGKWGLVPDMGGMALMKKLARDDIIRRLTYTAEMFNAPQALQWGFVSEIHPEPKMRAQKLAMQIAAQSPDAVRGAKKLITDVEDMTVESILLAEARAQEKVLGKKNQMEAVMSGLQKRIPKFADPE